MDKFNKTPKSELKRIPDRGSYNKEDVYRILDNSYLCHVGFVYHESPVIIPTCYGRKGDSIYIHGALSSRMLQELVKGIPVSICVSKINALVLTKSMFHHSLNYESVVIFGKAKMVEGEEHKMEALRLITENIIPSRWEEARIPNSGELKATEILEIEIQEATTKERTGPPKGDAKDKNLDVWSGLVPLNIKYENPISNNDSKGEINIPKSVKKLMDI